MIINPRRSHRTAQLAVLDPAVDWHEIYKRLTLWELPREARFGFQLAFYRPFAVPRMASVLHRTGHFRRDTTRRAYDTALVIHEIIYGGVDSDRGRKMIELMNRLHDRPDIHPDDLRYLLDAIIVVPTRFMDRYGWRTVTAAEREATWKFCNELGHHMGIANRATSYADAEQRLNAYEAANLAPSPAGRELTDAVLRTLRTLMPRPARPLAAQLTSALVGDPRVSAALSLPPPNPAITGLTTVGGTLRRHTQRLRPGTTQPSFWPGRHAGSIYPHGYTLDQLGPKQ